VKIIILLRVIMIIGDLIVLALRRVEVDDVEVIGKGSHDNEQEDEEDLHIIERGSDELDEVGECLEQSHPIEHLDPE
jgi:hypothetical protein